MPYAFPPDTINSIADSFHFVKRIMPAALNKPSPQKRGHEHCKEHTHTFPFPAWFRIMKEGYPTGNNPILLIASHTLCNHPEMEGIGVMRDSSEKNGPQQEQSAAPLTAHPLTGRFQSARLTGMIIAILFVLLGFTIHKGNIFQAGFLAWLLLLVGLGLFLLTWFSPDKLPFIKLLEKGLDFINQKLKLTPWQLALLVCSPFLLVVTRIAAGNDRMMRTPWLAVSAWLLAITFGMLAGWKREKIVWNRRTLILSAACMLGFIALAFQMRAFNLTHIPVNLTGDEASAGLFSLEIIDGKWNNIFRTGWFDFPALYSLIPAASISIFGQTIMGLRLPSAVAGSIVVGLLYLLGRVLYNHRTGVMAAALLAASHYHIHFSRIGLNNIWDGIFFVVFTGLFWRAWQKECRNLYLFAGLVLGLSQYFYASARLLPGLLLIWLVVFALNDWRKFKTQLGHFGYLLWLTMLVYAPLFMYTVVKMDQFMAPLSRVAFKTQTTGFAKIQLYMLQLAKGFGAYSLVDLQHWYAPGVPMLLYIEAVFFMLGILLFVAQWRSPKSWMLFSWLAAFSVMGALSELVPASQRYTASAPAAMLVAAFALDGVLNRLALIWKKIPHRVFNGFAWLVVLAAMLMNLNLYYEQYTPDSYHIDYNTLLAQRLADWLMDNPRDWNVYFFGHTMGYYSILNIQYLAPFATGYDMNEPWGSEKNSVVEPGDDLFIFLDQREDDLLAVKKQYPGCEERFVGDNVFGVMYTAWVCYDLQP
jgi:hypothetical protein